MFAMKVVTLVHGKVPPDKKQQFEAAYRSSKGTTIPKGLETSMLLRGSDEPDAYTILTIWSSREALQAMRSTERPRAVVLFEEVGVTPKVEVRDAVEVVP